MQKEHMESLGQGKGIETNFIGKFDPKYGFGKIKTLQTELTA